MKVKKVIAVVLGIAIPVGGTVFGINAYKSYQYSKLEAEVMPVSYVSWGYWGDTETSYGMVTNDSSQEIYLSDSRSVKKVYVAEGDTVAVGDPLIEYDTSELSIEIERKKLDLSILENDIAIAQHELEQFKAAKPVKKEVPTLDTAVLEELQRQDALNNMKPETDEKDSNIYNHITAGSLPYGYELDEEGKIIYPAGTVDEPYVYYCNEDAYIDDSFFYSIRPTEAGDDGKYVRFVVCKKNTDGTMLMASVPVETEPESGDGSNGGATSGAGSDGQPDSGESSGSDGNDGAASTENIGTGENGGTGTGTESNSTKVEVELVPVEDTSIAAKEYNGNSLPPVYGSGNMWYIFTEEPYVPVSLADQYLNDFFENSADWEEPEGYTEEEIATNIAEREKTLKSLDIQKRQMELQLQSMKNTAADGMVYATVDGVVKTAGNPEEYVNDGTAFLVVTGEEGLYVRGTISELLLGDVEVGTVVTANSWESGMSFEATITEIADYPTTGSSWGEGNPNVSYYSYTAYIEDSSMLRNGEYLDLSISTNQSETGGLYIEKAYVREEDGRSYVMIADENDCLKKQYVVTGRTIYGSAVEIKSGLTEEDRIAFPYGKNAVEGVAVKDVDNMYY